LNATGLDVVAEVNVVSRSVGILIILALLLHNYFGKVDIAAGDRLGPEPKLEQVDHDIGVKQE
jgi:hypothetical protein